MILQCIMRSMSEQKPHALCASRKRRCGMGTPHGYRTVYCKQVLFGHTTLSANPLSLMHFTSLLPFCLSSCLLAASRVSPLLHWLAHHHHPRPGRHLLLPPQAILSCSQKLLPVSSPRGNAVYERGRQKAPHDCGWETAAHGCATQLQ